MILHDTVKVFMFIHYTQLDECDDAEQCEENTDSSLEELEDIGSSSVQFNVLGQQDSEIQKKNQEIILVQSLPKTHLQELNSTTCQWSRFQRFYVNALEARGYSVQLLKACMTDGEDLTGFNSAMSDDEILSLSRTISSKSHSICHEYAKGKVCATLVGLLI